MRQPDDPGVDPLDPPDPFDPTGYYARKAKHRAEMIPYLVPIVLALPVIVLAAIIFNQENTMFGLSLTTLAIGVLAGIVLVQLYPPSARIGLWIVNKAKALLAKIRES